MAKKTIKGWMCLVDANPRNREQYNPAVIDIFLTLEEARACAPRMKIIPVEISYKLTSKNQDE